MDKDELLGEMKGRGNQKPAATYHPYILKLLEKPFIKGIHSGGYQPEQNFSISDLSSDQVVTLLKTRRDWVGGFLKWAAEDLKPFFPYSEAAQIAAVQQDGDAIQYIKNPSEKIQMAAVQQNGYAIQSIKNPSEEVQMVAVQQNGYAIQYIKNPSEEVPDGCCPTIRSGD